MENKTKLGEPEPVKSATIDDSCKALEVVLGALKNLTQEEQVRVLDTARTYYGLDKPRARDNYSQSMMSR